MEGYHDEYTDQKLTDMDHYVWQVKSNYHELRKAYVAGELPADELAHDMLLVEIHARVLHEELLKFIKHMSDVLGDCHG